MVGGTLSTDFASRSKIVAASRFLLSSGWFAGFLSAPLGLPLEYLNEDYAPLAVMFVELFRHFRTSFIG